METRICKETSSLVHGYFHANTGAVCSAGPFACIEETHPGGRLRFPSHVQADILCVLAVGTDL